MTAVKQRTDKSEQALQLKMHGALSTQENTIKINFEGP